MMKDQHKHMFLSLRAGEFDELIERVTSGGAGSLSPEPKPSRTPQLRAESSLPPLNFVAGEEPKTLPGMSTLIIERPSGALSEQRPPLRNEPAASVQNELRRAESAQFPAVIPKRPSGRPARKPKSSFPPGARCPNPGESEEVNTSARDRPSERPSRKLAVRPPTSTQEAIDPRRQSIFGEATAGKQTLDEVILSFLEDEET
jgi:hypothetical protein